jgi:Flp pilus assembly protein TadG
MTWGHQRNDRSGGGFFARLLRDRAGNTMAIVAAAIAPILAMVGGGVDMGRSYLSQSRLQQACDAGVLAARKALGTEAAITSEIPDRAAELGQRFFNINFRDGSYGTRERGFTMYLEDDYAITGEAEVTVPTTIMKIFGHDTVPIKVGCQAQINFSNTDVMMVLDVTGSMAETNAGDSARKIDVLKDTVRSFHGQLAAAAQAGTRVRYGFVPYSTNVNVGGLLDDDWVVDDWTYQSREQALDIKLPKTKTYETAPVFKSGTVTSVPAGSYPARYDKGTYLCDKPPAGSLKTDEKKVSETKQLVLLPIPGEKKTEHMRRTRNGVENVVTLEDQVCKVTSKTYTNYIDEFDRITEPTGELLTSWRYHPVTVDVSDWRTTSNGCMEERDTYDIPDYDNVDLTRALDLDLDLIPTDDPSTQWRPMFPGMIYTRALEWNGNGKIDPKEVVTDKEFVMPDAGGMASCPAPARRLAEMSDGELDSYLGTLQPAGSTYHDIGMIWGGRLISPTGLFADDNKDLGDATPTNRNLIFLTDGETAPRDLNYGTYGLEPLDQRRWNPKSPFSLTQTVEKRFAFACSEVRKRNVTVWVIGFGTDLNPVMKDCAGEGHYFEAADAAELNATFAAIAKKMSELRISK